MKTSLTTVQKASARSSGYTMLEIMLVVSLIGLMTAIGVPNFLKSRGNAQLGGILDNLRLIEDAKDSWALQNHKGTGDAADWSVLTEYLKGGTVRSVASESYFVTTIGSAAYATCPTKLGTYDSGTPISAQ